MARHEPYFLPHPIQPMTTVTVHTFYAKDTVLATCVTILSFCSIKYPPFFIVLLDLVQNPLGNQLSANFFFAI